MSPAADDSSEQGHAGDADAELPHSEPSAPGGGPVRPGPVRTRTQDVVSDAASFRELMISEPLLTSLAAAGFERPSPVQKAAIPLGRVGTDLIVQAKSGTGKTVVFAAICLERVKPEKNCTQALVLAPTREIAIQSEQVIRALASELPGPAITSGAFVGGLPMIDDEKRLRRLCHVAVGTPGRIGALLQAGRLVPDDIALLVLDEADSLLGDSFYEDVTWIYDQLPKRKQVLAFSATYTPELLADLEPLMRRPQRVMTCSESVSLLGVKQFYSVVDTGGEAAATAGAPETESEAASTLAGKEATSSAAPAVFRRKVQQLLRLLAGVSFHQAVVFCNHKPRAEWLAEQLSAAGYPAAYLSGDRAQVERMEAMAAVRGFKLRVVVSTDVMARGVDLERVNLVINLDLPHDAATYMHRVGRTGRFGTRGVCVSYVTQAELALVVSYVDEQAAAAAAAAEAATAAAAANGGGEGGAAVGAGAELQESPATAPAGEGHSGAAEEILMPLPDVIPEDLYGYELGSDWERKALQQLICEERHARQQLLLQKQQQQNAGVDQGRADTGEAAVTSNTDGQAAAVATNGIEPPPACGRDAVALPELPPLPEEVKAAKKAEEAAQAAARKADRELQKQQHREQQRREQQQQLGAVQGQAQQQQYNVQYADWTAYGQHAYSPSYDTYGTGAYATVAHSSSTAGEPSNDWYSAQYGRSAWPQYTYPTYYSSPYGAYAGHSTPSSDALQTSSAAYSTQEGTPEAAWARYYQQYYPQSYTSGPADWQMQNRAGAPGAAQEAARASSSQIDGLHPARHAASAPVGVSRMHVRGATLLERRTAEAVPCSSRSCTAAGGEGQAEPDESGSDDDSELSFSALRGQPASPPRATASGALACGGRSGTGRAAAAQPHEADADQVDADGDAGPAEIEDEDGEEDDSWVLGEEDLTGQAARVVDNLVVLLPPSDAAEPDARDAGGGSKKGAAGGPGMAKLAAAGAARSEQQGASDTAAAGTAGDTAPQQGGTSYGQSYGAYGTSGYGWQGVYQHPNGGRPHHGGASHGQQEWGYGWGHPQGPWQQYPSGPGWQHGPQDIYRCAYHHAPGPSPPSYHPPHPHPPPLHAPPPPHHRRHHHHHHPPPPYPYHHHFSAPYAHSSAWGYPPYPPPEVGYQYERYGSPGESRCAECVRRAVREYVQQHGQWQQAYATWYAQYQRWYDSWLLAAAQEEPSGDAAAVEHAEGPGQGHA